MPDTDRVLLVKVPEGARSVAVAWCDTEGRAVNSVSYPADQGLTVGDVQAILRRLDSSDVGRDLAAKLRAAVNDA